MSRISFASHPFLLGFDELDRMVERMTKSGADGYPPFNIEQRGENAFRITLAVAGFGEDDLSITVEDRSLVVRGRQSDEAGSREFLHRGIAARQFQKSFLLADRVEVTGASLDKGLLHVDLTRREPESVVQTIRIGRPE
jgi:HSP20 family molecular chaperone IbpA